MPELPEVETVVRGLQASVVGRRVLSLRLGKTDFIDDPSAIEALVPGTRVAAIRRYGKFLVFELHPGSTAETHLDLLIHLGMTGQLTTRRPEEPVAPHTHAFFALDDGTELRYTDVRRFGRFAIIANSEREKILGPLGLDPLEATEEEFGQRLSGRRTRIKSLLLNQSFLRGMGNIYTDEALWRARIHPMRLAANLKNGEIARLYKALRQVLEEAIRLRGSSVSDYVDSNGVEGEFQLRHRVYHRHGKKCFRCGAKIRRMIVAGRSSHFCPRCQRAPRLIKSSRGRSAQRKR